MREYVKYRCSTCKYYEYEDENKKNYCQWYKAYYYCDDQCDHWKETDSYSSGSGGCFMTTACCNHRGLSDDCEELQTMRTFRDEYLLKDPETAALVHEYYRIAPGIVTAVNARPDRDAIWEDVYARIRSIMESIKEGRSGQAIDDYRAMVLDCQAVTA